jgi:hypothetical protein
MNLASGRVKLLKGWLMEEGEETNQLTKEEGKVRTVLSASVKRQGRDEEKDREKMKIYRLEKSFIVTASG